MLLSAAILGKPTQANPIGENGLICRPMQFSQRGWYFFRTYDLLKGMRNGPECLQFQPLVHELRQVFAKAPEWRDTGKIDYPLVDVAVSGLAMMFLQDPGLLPFQQRLQEKNGSSNLRNFFSVSQVPRETQFRDLLDSFDFHCLMAGLRRGITLLESTRAWLGFRNLDGRFIVALDGTEYFQSEKIHCEHCLERHHKDGRVEYYHQLLVAALIHPVTGQALPMCVEEIRRDDGTTKQDCEINAASRLLPRLAKTYCHLDMIIIGDSLYSKTPFMELARSLKLNFILVAQPGDHRHLQEEIAGIRLAEGITRMEQPGEGKIANRIYEFAHEVPLFSSTTATAHWVEYSELMTSGKAGYHNAWVTSLKPTRKNIQPIVATGRHRSSIENQTFNALKNHGFHFEHNFGHGKKFLRINFLLLNLLAFMMHQLLSIGDQLYIEAKTWKGSVRQFIEHIRWATRMVLWPNWTILLNHFLDRGPELRLESG